MRLVFLGTPQAAVPSLEALGPAGHRISLVVSRPDRPVGRSRRPVAPPVKRAAEGLGLDLFQPAKVRNAAFRERLESARPDLLVVVAYGRILPLEVLRLAPHGAINLHFSLLPRYRGAAPVHWALARGEELTGVTTMLVNERMDEGDLLLQQPVPVEPDEHSPALGARLAKIGAGLLVRTIAELDSGSLEPREQDHSRATYAPLLTRADGEIDLTLRSEEIAGRVRGFDPWPGVWLGLRGKRVRIVESRVLSGPPCDAPPGRLLELAAEGLVMACAGGGRLLLTVVQPQGSRALTARDAVNGRHLQPGEQLEGLASAQ